MHNNLFVQHVLILHWDYLKSMGCYSRLHVVWSDGCSTQFKCARAWYFVTQYAWLSICKERLEGVQMCWNYFAFDHGKGRVDGEDTLLKHEIHKDQIKAQAIKLQNAHDVVTFCR
jgi:hypothetical protein